ncbi:MAG: 2OG-Fe dioxygenase family protein, partial [Betaproteobacteria bacterium]
LAALGRVFAAAAATPVTRWYVEAHQFRIDTAQGIGRPTPEGAHRDGVDFVAVVLVQRQAVRGGETRVFQADAPFGVRFTLAQPWSALLLDDARVVHETTPIQSAAAPSACAGWRDTLVLTYRRDRFQDPSR